MKLSTLFLRAAFGMLLCTGCSLGGDDADDGGAKDKTEDIPLFTEKADGKVLGNNTSTDDLVLFHSAVLSSRVIGGLPANASGHRMKLPSVGGGGEFYVIYAVRYADYKGKPAGEIANLKVVDSAFVYSDPNSDTSFDIGNPNFGGNAKIQFKNQTGSWIEIGKGSPHVEDRFYVLKPDSEGEVSVTPEKDGFPLYYTVHIPIKKSGQIIGVQRSYFDADRCDPQPGAPAVITISSTGEKAIIPFYREGYVRVINNYDHGYTMTNGSTVLYSTLQVSIIAAGKEQVFELLGAAGEGQNYEQLKLIAIQAQYNKNIPALKVKNGHAYTVEINASGEVSVSDKVIELNAEEEEIQW